MRNILLFSLLSSILTPAAAQVVPALREPVATRIQLPGADCALFPATAELPICFYTDVTTLERFTPTPQQIALVEKAFLPIRIKQLAITPSAALVDSDREAEVFIYNNLKKYYRQYYGFYNSLHQPCLYVNCFIGDEVADGNSYDIAPYWLRRPVSMLYGGANYWSITFNVATQELYNFRYNSSSP